MFCPDELGGYALVLAFGKHPADEYAEIPCLPYPLPAAGDVPGRIKKRVATAFEENTDAEDGFIDFFASEMTPEDIVQRAFLLRQRS
jgi:hypothetical protein